MKMATQGDACRIGANKPDARPLTAREWEGLSRLRSNARRGMTGLGRFAWTAFAFLVSGLGLTKRREPYYHEFRFSLEYAFSTQEGCGVWHLAKEHENLYEPAAGPILGAAKCSSGKEKVSAQKCRGPVPETGAVLFPARGCHVAYAGRLRGAARRMTDTCTHPLGMPAFKDGCGDDIPRSPCLHDSGRVCRCFLESYWRKSEHG